MAMTVLVTGASGGVGDAIVRRLQMEGHASPVALDVLPPLPDPSRAVRPTTVLSDLRVDSLEDAVRIPVDAVVHCAARIPGPGASDDLCATDNRRIDDQVLAFCEARHVPAIVFSTAAVYPQRSDGAWVDERSPVGPTGSYAAAKLESERRFLGMDGARAAIFRITSPFGPAQRNESVIRRFCRAAMGNRPIEVWGSGSREQDFIHLDDIAGAVGAALDAPEFPAGVHLVASGRPTTTLELATTILEAAGSVSGVNLGARPDPEDSRTARYSIRQEPRRDRLGAQAHPGRGRRLLPPGLARSALMLMGLFSDAHGNAAATADCIRELRARGAEHIVFLGDAVGYLGRGRETMEAIDAASDLCLLGNHDAYAAGLAPYPSEHEPVYRTREAAREIGERNVARLAARLPLHVQPAAPGNLLLVHGSPWNPLSGYVYPDADLTPFESLPYRAVVMGHTHRPFVRRSGTVLVVNCGSCGLPRDRGDLGACILLDTGSLEVEIVRFPIDATLAVAGDCAVHESTVRIFARRPAGGPESRGGST